MSPTISIIICAYTEQRWVQLQSCIESARLQSLPAQEIIIVIDHNEALLARAQARFTDAFVIPNRHPQGLSGARNTGIACATGEILAFVDDDAVIAPDWLERLCACLDNPLTLGAGGTITPLWEDKQPRWFLPEFFWVIGCTFKGQPQTRQSVRNLWGDMCVRRSVFDTVGGFHTSIGRIGTKPLGDEETELCIRANIHWPQAQWEYEPAAVMRHWVPKTRATWEYFCSRCYHEGISKSVVSRMIGRDRGLSTERDYVLRVLPRAVGQGLLVAFHGDISGLLRAGAGVIGLLLTTLGYVIGSFTISRGSHALAPDEIQVAIAPSPGRPS